MELSEKEVQELCGIDADELYELGAEFEVEVAIALMKAGEIVKRKSLPHGYKLHRHITCGQEQTDIAWVSNSGKVIATTHLTSDDILAADYQIVRFK